MENSPVLKEAYQLIKSGDKARARQMLLNYVKQNPQDKDGWWLMAHAVSDSDQRKKSLERAVRIDPDFAAARQALRKLDEGGAAAAPAARTEKPKVGAKGGGIYDYPLRLRFKIIALAPQIYITDASDAPVLYVRQKIFNLREDVRIFRDDSKSEEIFRINADRIIDIGARYRFTDSKTERPLGAIKQRGLKTIWRAHYDIEEPGTEKATHSLTEDNPWVKVADAILGEIPFLNFFTGFFIHPSYTVTDGYEKGILRLTKEPAFFESRFRIDLLDSGISAEEEKRLLLGVMMMIQLSRARG